MSFRYQETHDGNYEVIMCEGTLCRRADKERRFALCTHENDAQVIVSALNDIEKKGGL